VGRVEPAVTAPAVSILLPVRNAAPYLAEALDSLICQTFNDFEILAVDDGSEDNSADILRSYSDRDPRFRCTFSGRRGLVASLNSALAEARAPLVARMDADDISLPERLAKQVAHLDARPECVAVGCDVTLVDAEGQGLSILQCETEAARIEAELLRGGSRAVVHPATMIRRSALLAVGGYDPAWDGVEDLDLFLRLTLVGKLENVPEVLYLYRQHHDSVCNRSAERLQRLAVELILRVRQERGLEPLLEDEQPAWRQLSKPARHRAWALWAKGSGDRATAYKHARLARSTGMPWTATLVLAVRIALPRGWGRFTKALRRPFDKAGK
jgi:glycosyltransferase involved in cell wall biosynthesis